MQVMRQVTCVCWFVINTQNFECAQQPILSSALHIKPCFTPKSQNYDFMTESQNADFFVFPHCLIYLIIKALHSSKKKRKGTRNPSTCLRLPFRRAHLPARVAICATNTMTHRIHRLQRQSGHSCCWRCSSQGCKGHWRGRSRRTCG